MAYTITQKYFNHFGVDLKSNELTRPGEFASNMLNSQYAADGAITKRYGSKACSKHAGGYGLFTYYQYESNTGVQTPKLLTVDDELWQYNETTFGVVYAGTATTCLFSLLLDPTTQTFKVTMIEGPTTVLDFDLGIGYDEAAPITLADLKVAIDAIPGFTATITGTTTISAAFLNLVDAHDLVVSNLTMSALDPVKVYCPVTKPFSTYYAYRNTEGHENVSSVQMNGVIYFGTGYTPLYKYDGQTLYRAGLPKPKAFTFSKSAGAITGTNYIWVIQYQQVDNAGNIVEGNYTLSSMTNLSAQKATLTIPNITRMGTVSATVVGNYTDVNQFSVNIGGLWLPVGEELTFTDSGTGLVTTRSVSDRTYYAGGFLVVTIDGPPVTLNNGTAILTGVGFNTNCAISANALQVEVNVINVAAGHTLRVGDKAYYYDFNLGSYNTAKITHVTANTITVEGVPASLLANTVISNNLKINIFRSKSSGSTPTMFYLLWEIANNSFATTQTFVDDTEDAFLQGLFTAPATDRSLPVKGKYLGQWNGIMVVGGNLEEPNIVYYSDVDSPEYHPAGFNQFVIESGEGDNIAGLKSNNEVFCVYGDRSFAVISGEVSSAQIRLDFKALNVGALSHASIDMVESELFWLSTKGPKRSSGGAIPQPIGVSADPTGKDQNASRIDPIVDNSTKTPEQIFNFKRSIGVNLGFDQKYLLFIPAESTTAGAVHPNDNSRIYVYDYARDAWLIWADMNMAGGATSINDEFYFLERRYSDFESAVQSVLYTRLKDYGDYNYADHNRAINANYYPQWESLGNPSVLKKFLNMRLTSIENFDSSSFTLRVKQEFDYETDAILGDFNIETQNYGYGSSPYGSNPYGSSMASTFTHGLARQRARACRVSFHNNTIHENYIITGWELEVATPYKPELKP